MGQDLKYTAESEVCEYPISRADWKLIQTLRTRLPNEMEALFIVPSLGEEVRVETSVLRAAAGAVSAFIACNRHLLPYTFQFKPEFMSDPRITPGFSTGGMSGIRLVGDNEHFYSLWTGLNECRLKKTAIGPDGRGHKVDERDLRGERELLSTNLGKIKIRRTRAKTELVKALPEIERFLQRAVATKIIKSIS